MCPLNNGYRMHDPLSELVSLDVYCVVDLYRLFVSAAVLKWLTNGGMEELLWTTNMEGAGRP